MESFYFCVCVAAGPRVPSVCLSPFSAVCFFGGAQLFRWCGPAGVWFWHCGLNSCVSFGARHSALLLLLIFLLGGVVVVFCFAALLLPLICSFRCDVLFSGCYFFYLFFCVIEVLFVVPGSWLSCRVRVLCVVFLFLFFLVCVFWHVLLVFLIYWLSGFYVVCGCSVLVSSCSVSWL